MRRYFKMKTVLPHNILNHTIAVMPIVKAKWVFPKRHHMLSLIRHLKTQGRKLIDTHQFPRYVAQPHGPILIHKHLLTSLLIALAATLRNRAFNVSLKPSN
jgi:hypothetical protein